MKKTNLILLGLFFLVNSCIFLIGADESLDNKKALANEFYNLGEQYFAKKKYEDALKAYTKSLKYNPDFPEALYKKGETLELLCNELTALKYYKSCSECLQSQDDLDEKLKNIKEKCSSKIEKTNKSINALNNHDCESVNALITLVGKTMDIADHILAKEVLEVIIKINPGHEKSMEYLQKIESSFRKEFNQDLTYLNYNLGIEEFKNGNYKKASEKFEEALKYAKDTFNIHIKLGECYEKLKDLSGASRNYRCCMQLLRNKQTLTDEENKNLEKIGAFLKKSDVFAQEFSKLKSYYVQRMLGFGKNCISAKQFQIALTAFNHAMIADSDNKTIQDSLKKCSENIITVTDTDEPGMPKNTIRLFNGLDINDWLTNWGAFPRIWEIKDGMLIADVPANGQSAILIHKNLSPKNYTLVYEFKVNEIKVPDNNIIPSLLGIILACDGDPHPGKADSTIKLDSIDAGIQKMNEGKEIKVTIHKKDKQFEGSYDFLFGGETKNVKIPPRKLEYDYEYVGIKIINMKITISSITLTTQ
jgi:tetratricopeptide (TPR) repeat protein